MKMVINIPDNVYGWIKREWPRDNTDSPLNHICNAILDGTPLPKGHGRLIDADALNLYNISPRDDENLSVYGVTAEDIVLAETIIEADEVTE